MATVTCLGCLTSYESLPVTTTCCKKFPYTLKAWQKQQSVGINTTVSRKSDRHTAFTQPSDRMTYILIPGELPGPAHASQPSLGPVGSGVMLSFAELIAATLSRIQEAWLLLADQPHLAAERKVLDIETISTPFLRLSYRREVSTTHCPGWIVVYPHEKVNIFHPHHSVPICIYNCPLSPHCFCGLQRIEAYNFSIHKKLYAHCTPLGG